MRIDLNVTHTLPVVVELPEPWLPAETEGAEVVCCLTIAAPALECAPPDIPTPPGPPVIVTARPTC